MYFGCHGSNWIAWGSIALGLAIPIITLIVGAAGGWGCKLTCTEDSDDAVPVGEGIYACSGGAIFPNGKLRKFGRHTNCFTWYCNRDGG